GLAGGSYNVLITDSNGCFTVVGGVVSQPIGPLLAEINPPPGRCPDATGQIYANASGGTPPYTYVWSPASGLSNPNIPNPIATYTINTSYTVIVTDANG